MVSLVPGAGPLPRGGLPPNVLFALPGQWKGMLMPGNLNLLNRPIVRHPDGSISTVLTTSFADPRLGGHEVLIPQVVGGKILNPHAAWQNYLSTGEHLGIFRSPAAANAYGEALHRQQARLYGGR